MKNIMKKILENEVVLYLIFGVATTLVYMVTRIALFAIINQIVLVALIANIFAILFAFVTNDRIVFKQSSQGWFPRFIKFISARLVTMGLDMLLAFILVQAFPILIGQFVNNDLRLVNAIATLFSQITAIVLNYVLSKLFVFKDKQ
ncbi:MULTISPECIES: GtrA family protein [Streptococcus]|uniref:GtrA family protein n=2 Tax=Streptococcus TaxID=1301 RepID=A0A2Z5TL73_9STRE|nr:MULTISPECIES: GtrA family protein [Streptococcus]MDQ8837742.1 GtrA family protein [Streptococcus ruminantium]QHF54307.1 sugar translocase [Streptococcus sp. DAT741]BBA92139.1 GtrA family protein [Streptococcus ruminantium]BDD38285.1 cell wall teichoic acid glycosylation protein [Streptococcus ruminantium]BDD40239.1 cell wall teichoic acid glycosylation protein [Streptococcus ruminantium]